MLVRFPILLVISKDVGTLLNFLFSIKNVYESSKVCFLLCVEVELVQWNTALEYGDVCFLLINK